MKPDAEHVDTEPRPAGDDVAKDGHHHQSPMFDQAAPAGVEDDSIPEHDEERAVFLRIPAPKAAPGLICPDAAENRSDEAEQRRETNDAVNHCARARARSPGSAMTLATRAGCK